MAGQGGSIGDSGGATRPLRVAVLGAGTVGREVVAGLLEGRSPGLAPESGAFELVGVAARDLVRAAASGIPAHLLTDAPAHLVAGATDVVVELMGGEEPARTLIAAALTAGKAVVTANKYVVARHGPELEAIARLTRAPFRYEAAVMGGTPILRLLSEDLAGTTVSSLRGIVNGTTNHILTEMAANGVGYADALADAQASGYAEADPTGDVEGGDAADKLVVLARLAFGVWLDRAGIAVHRRGDRPGITGVTAGDLARANRDGLAIRLLASARRRASDGRLEAAVLTTAVPEASALGQTNGVRNRIEIEAERLGRLAVEGPGAGGAATAAAVLADLLAVRRGDGSTWGDLPAAALETAASLLPKARSFFVGPSGVKYPVED
ncbi:MAG: homoserine dehydrogenase [Chloroflexi bacterium]|nr:homoserine dehydrogenase [Chloroflexota bacterium]